MGIKMRFTLKFSPDATLCALPAHQIQMEFNTMYVFMCLPSV